MRKAGLVLFAAVALSSCALGRNDGPKPETLAPEFTPSPTTLLSSNTSVAPLPKTGGGTGTPLPDASAGGDANPATTTAPSVAQPGAAAMPAAFAPTSATMSDRKGDVTLSVDRPPAWVDLLGATLTRRPEGFELRVKMAGDVPSTYESERTLNVASFYDVTGDGSIDFEVWVNLASGGWGGSYFDNTRRGANRINDDTLTVTPQGSELVVTFPLSHLASAARMQWATAMEWGRYEVIGTAAAARDDAPDNDAAASFPS